MNKQQEIIQTSIDKGFTIREIAYLMGMPLSQLEFRASRNTLSRLKQARLSQLTDRADYDLRLEALYPKLAKQDKKRTITDNSTGKEIYEIIKSKGFTVKSLAGLLQLNLKEFQQDLMSNKLSDEIKQQINSLGLVSEYGDRV